MNFLHTYAFRKKALKVLVLQHFIASNALIAGGTYLIFGQTLITHELKIY